MEDKIKENNEEIVLIDMNYKALINSIPKADYDLICDVVIQETKKAMTEEFVNDLKNIWQNILRIPEYKKDIDVHLRVKIENEISRVIDEKQLKQSIQGE